MRSKSGFTIVELVVIITVIGILSAITIVGMTVYQVGARNSDRASKVAVLSESLEKYYDKNGEYPSPRSLTNNYVDNSAQFVAQKLSVDTDILRMPMAQPGVENSFVDTLASEDAILYIAKSDVNNTSCQTKKDGGCDEYTLSYKEEGSDTVISIESRKKGRSAGLPTAPDEAPPAPELSAGLEGSSVVVESSETLCEAPLQPKYAFQHKINTGAWSSFSAWGTAVKYSIPGTAGNTYYFKAVARCDNGPAPGPVSAESAEESIVFPVGAPAAPVTSVALSGSNVVATVAVVSCPAPTTPQYAIRSRLNTATWSAYSAWSTTRTASQAVNQGVKYAYQAQARCVGTSTTSAAATGTEASYVHPISTPAAPSVSISTSGTLTTWSWPAVSCPAGSTPRYQYQSTADWGYTSSWIGPSTALLNNWTTTNQGYEYTRSIQAHCYNVNTTSAWSASSTRSYIRPIAAPGAATGFVSSMSSDKRVLTWTWTAPTCGPGTVYNGIHKYHWNEGKADEWHPAPGAQGYYAPKAEFKVVGGVPHSSGTRMRVSVPYACVNAATGRSSAWGPEATSGTYVSP